MKLPQPYALTTYGRLAFATADPLNLILSVYDCLDADVFRVYTVITPSGAEIHEYALMGMGDIYDGGEDWTELDVCFARDEADAFAIFAADLPEGPYGRKVWSAEDVVAEMRRRLLSGPRDCDEFKALIEILDAINEASR